MQDWLTTSATKLGRGIERGKIDPVALIQTYLEAIAEHPERDRIYARVTPDRAVSEAGAAARRAKAGQRLSPLDGVPVSWKDLFDSAGVGTEAGTALLKGRVPLRDARVLANATSLGLVCLGKTHMSELAFSGLGLNPMTATPPCVNDAQAVPGGSSSGAAASVAFGLAAAAVGSDTGGSVRVPGAWNDLVGLKTTHGLLPNEGVVPLAAKFDTVGPLCRTVEDAAAMLAALGGRAMPDLRGASLRGMRLGAVQNVVLDDLRDGPAGAYEAGIERLEAAGARVEPVTVQGLEAAMADTGVLYTGEAYGLWRDAIEAQPDAMYPPIRERFQQGQAFSAPDYVAAWTRLETFRKGFLAQMAGFDALIWPTAANLPPDKARLMQDKAYYVTENLLTLRNTRVANLAGLCALSLPLGVPSCGMSLACPPMQEARLLRLGAAAEAVLTG